MQFREYSDTSGEKLLEVCYLGDIQAVKKVLESGTDINFANKLNKWTPLHWAVSQNHVALVKYLTEEGANRNAYNDKCQTPIQLSTSQEIDKILKTTNSPIENNPTRTSQFSEELLREKHGFVPNFIQYPRIAYPGRQAESPADSIRIHSKEICIKARIGEVGDFIEVDIDIERCSFKEFTLILCRELEIDTNAFSVKKIRKLPNTIVRNDRDITRLKEGTEIEFLLSR